jgi:small subunit ribosomal protein S6
MKTYELMVIFSPEVDPADEKKRDDLVKKMLNDTGAKIKSINTIGKKHLSYDIKKQKEGVYVLATVEAQTLNVGQIKKQTNLIPEILRFLFTNIKE